MNQGELRKKKHWCGWSITRGSGTARDEAEDRNAGQSKQDLVGCVSKNNGKTMKSFKHGGNMTASACFFFLIIVTLYEKIY